MKEQSSGRWHFAGKEAEKELGGNVLALLAGAETVKSNAVRKVFRNGAYYIKLDRRAGRSFYGEFRAAGLCRSAGIEVVEHLACGRSADGACLVTRAAENFIEAASLFRTRQRWELYESFAAFLGRLLASGLYHPDLHPGNILIDPETAECRLVDLHGVRRRTLFDRLFRMGLMERCIMEVRNCCSDSEMARLLKKCSVRNPEAYFKKSLAKEAFYLEENMPKRKHQILNGYFKYTRLEGDGRLVDVESSEKELFAAEVISLPEARELFLFHFFLTQARIPHRRILALDPLKEQVWLENELPEQYRSNASAYELAQRLKYNRLESCESDYKQGYLDDIAGVFRKNSK